MNKELISIILPVYNAKQHLEQTINSILKQTYQNFELIIVNDGSTDTSEQIIKNYMKITNKIKYICITNNGVSNARNIAIKNATGTLVTFIDSDDWYEYNFLELMYKAYKNEKSDLVCCSYKACGKKIKIVTIKNKIENNNIKDYIETLQPNLLFNQLWNKLYKLDIIRNNKITFDTKIDLAEDYKFNLDYIDKIKSPTYLDIPLYNYRINPNGLGFKYRKNSNQIKFQLLKKLDKLYQTHKFNKEYIYINYLIQYFSQISNIVDKQNKVSTKEKISEINKIITSKKYKDTLSKIKQQNKTLKIVCYILLINNEYIIYCLGILANYYDKYKKTKMLSKR